MAQTGVARLKRFSEPWFRPLNRCVGRCGTSDAEPALCDGHQRTTGGAYSCRSCVSSACRMWGNAANPTQNDWPTGEAIRQILELGLLGSWGLLCLDVTCLGNGTAPLIYKDAYQLPH